MNTAVADHREALLYLYDYCNYKCNYCLLNADFYVKREHSRATTPEGVDSIIEFFSTAPGWRVLLTGGEPTLHPEFLRLCQGLAKHNLLRLDTNGSVDSDIFDRFTESISPDRVDFIQFSLHEPDEDGQRLANYLHRVARLRAAGYRAFVTYVAAPARLKSVPPLYRAFYTRNVPFVVTPLRTREYPAAYTDEERAFLDRYMSSAVHRAYLDINERRPKGRLCNAGRLRINVDGVDGRIRGCWRSQRSIGNVYDGKLELSRDPVQCGNATCSYVYEPCICTEELVWADMENILNLEPIYDRELYRKLVTIG